MMGRPSIFHGKRHRVQGFISAVSMARVKAHRRWLAEKVGWEEEDVSMADTWESLARGCEGTEDYLVKHPVK
jgi:hypothetical protein